jgi:PadR family transcriptional regulator, regulatory protein PadR
MPPIETQQLNRTLNEILILAVLQSGPKHGYQIAVEIEESSDGFFGFTHGTLYPILHHLEKEGLVDGEWESGGSRRKRKVYRLTAAGRANLRERAAGWRELHERLSAFVVAHQAVRPGLAANQ